jgi:hypothetical protein
MLIAVPLNPVTVAKRAFWLAFQASRAQGMGHLHAEAAKAATEDDVWRVVMTDEWTGKSRDFPYGDYVFGRMMKTRLQWTSDEIQTPESEPRFDYQSWCGRYGGYGELVDAAVSSLKEEQNRSPNPEKEAARA